MAAEVLDWGANTN